MNVRKDDSKREFGNILAAWKLLHGKTRIGVIQSKSEHSHMVNLLNGLVDIVGDNENHELVGLLDLVGVLIQQYEEGDAELPSLPPREMLRFLMVEHNIKQGDLRAELGSQGVVSEILSGRREINARQAKALAQRFNVSPLIFL